MQKKIYDCSCEFTEIVNDAVGGSARGWTLTKECDDCKNKRELASAEAKAKQDAIIAEQEARVLAEKQAKEDILGRLDKIEERLKELEDEI